ncbi:MAG: formate--tetrahydrofolate ligase [Alphaproteobacteria bacterium]|nr:formate--tetrahydrofolate ligase [Alphaproteobacteria bacterium]
MRLRQGAAVAFPIFETAQRLGLDPDTLIPYGRRMAKVPLSALAAPRPRPGKGRLVLVSAITPTPAGEGKTTTSIGLAQGLACVGESVCLALREPSLGPVFGVKGGGTGGGRSTLEPSTDINLHFTGDLHAITAANNLLAAVVDNHLHQRSAPPLDPRRVLWRRVMDMNDRSLREVITGLGGPAQGIPRQGGFDITAASEIMAIVCLAEGPDDLRARLERILVGFTEDRKPLLAGELGATGALMALLRDAMNPNLVASAEGVPAFVHGGPFANIAHGCNSVAATRMALHHADWAITEAGFGFDLGAEKFFDIKCAGAGLDTAAVVLVATARALKYHGGVGLKALTRPDPEAVARGLANLEKHAESIALFGEKPVVAINRFHADTEDELAVIRERCDALGLPVAVSDHFARGGAGAEDLARLVVAHAERSGRPFRPIYDWSDPIPDKIRAIVQAVYGGKDVIFTKDGERALKRVERLGYAGLPVCLAKTQASLSDDPKLRGRPRDFEITVRDIAINAGAGFLVVLTGDLLRMPGLPRRPSALDIDLVDGQIVGVS